LAAALETEKPVAVILVGGGARSGKSRYALEKARALQGTRAFVATAQPSDEEMIARIRNHREERGDEFSTIEEPIELPRVIAEAKFDVLVVDCLTLWLSNIMFANKIQEIDALESAAQLARGTVIFVTNEVGSGIVPTDNALSRDFRDRAGILNQRIAEISQEVYFMVFGQPLRVK
jgi:adenosylcobinamide kinase/adenosylcobinamide-phosphate guanylyltransferase